MRVTNIELFFGALLAIAALAFSNTYFLQQDGMVIDSLLLVQVIRAELRGKPSTGQFTRRMYPPDLCRTRPFLLGNRPLSRIWDVIFILDILMSAFGAIVLFQFTMPNVLFVVALFADSSLAQWYSLRVVVAPSPTP